MSRAEFQVLKATTVRLQDGSTQKVGEFDVIDFEAAGPGQSFDSSWDYWKYLTNLVRKGILEPLAAVPAGPFLTRYADPLVFWQDIVRARRQERG